MVKTKSKPNPNSTRASTLPSSPASPLWPTPVFSLYSGMCFHVFTESCAHPVFVSASPSGKTIDQSELHRDLLRQSQENGERRISTNRVQTCTLTQHKPFHQIHQVSNSGTSVCHGPVKASIMALQRLLQTRKAFTDLSKVTWFNYKPCSFSVPHATVFLPLLYFLLRYIKY